MDSGLQAYLEKLAGRKLTGEELDEADMQADTPEWQAYVQEQMHHRNNALEADRLAPTKVKVVIGEPVITSKTDDQGNKWAKVLTPPTQPPARRGMRRFDQLLRPKVK